MPFGNNNAGGGGFGSDALAFGMMNSIKTGNPLIDIMCCSIITPLLQSVQSLVDNTRPWLTTAWKFVKRRGRNEYRRVIRYERRMTNWGSEAIDKEGKNNILQKARFARSSLVLVSSLVSPRLVSSRSAVAFFFGRVVEKSHA
jgi:hypothetical protein